MRITAINTAVHFGSKVKVQTRSVQSVPQYDTIDNDKLLKNSLGLTAIGLTTIGIYMVNKKGWNPLNTIKSVKRNIQDTVKSKLHTAKMNKNPLFRMLNGERDAKALQKYNTHKAENKLNSLSQKFESGYFNDKPADIIEKIKSNAIKLAKEAGKMPINIPN